VDSDSAQVADEARRNAQEGLIIDEIFEREAIAARILERAALHLPAGLSHQARSLAKVGAIGARPVCRGLQNGLAESFLRDATTKGLQQLKLFLGRHAFSYVERTLERGLAAFVKIVEQVAVDPLEVEAERDCPANTRIAETLA